MTRRLTYQITSAAGVALGRYRATSPGAAVDAHYAHIEGVLRRPASPFTGTATEPSGRQHHYQDGRYTGQSHGPSGAHTSPRRVLSATPEQWAAWDGAAKGAGLSWAEWARARLDA